MNIFLEHHGIKGQKWGVRRFQNADGSYTQAGLTRRGLAGSKNKNKPQAPDFRVEVRKTRRSDTLKRARKEDINKLSDSELRKYNERLQLEQNFERLREDNFSRAQNYVVKALTTMTIAAASAFVTSQVMSRGSNYTKEVFDAFEDSFKYLGK